MIAKPKCDNRIPDFDDEMFELKEIQKIRDVNKVVIEEMVYPQTTLEISVEPGNYTVMASKRDIEDYDEPFYRGRQQENSWF